MIQEYNTLSEANWARFKEGKLKNSNNYNVQFWTTKLLEELGEFAAGLNKDKGKDYLEQELADMYIIVNLIAQIMRIDLNQVAVDKFNQTSIDKGSDVRIKI